MSLRSIPRAAAALRGAVSAPRVATTTVLPQCVQQRRWASDEKKPKPPPMTSFHQQLFKSMGQRIASEKREMAELAQYERTRWSEKVFGTFFGTYNSPYSLYSKLPIELHC